MNPNGFGVSCSVAALVLFWVVERWGVRQPEVARRRWPWIVSALALPGLGFAAYYTHLIPDSAAYFEFRSWPGTELLLLPVGWAGGLLSARAPGRLRILLLLLTAAVVVLPVLKPIIGPIPADVLKDTWKGEICLQSTPSTCGPASAATILRSLGIRSTESELAAEAHSYVGGTEAWSLARAIRRRGVQVRFQTGPEWDPGSSLPAIVGVKVFGTGHFIALLSREGDRFRVGDPLEGEAWLNEAELRERYSFTGFSMKIFRSNAPRSP